MAHTMFPRANHSVHVPSIMFHHVSETMFLFMYKCTIPEFMASHKSTSSVFLCG